MDHAGKYEVIGKAAPAGNMTRALFASSSLSYEIFLSHFQTVEYPVSSDNLPGWSFR